MFTFDHFVDNKHLCVNKLSPNIHVNLFLPYTLKYKGALKGLQAMP